MSRLAVGFTQRIQLEWLEWTAQMALAGLSESQIRAELQSRLRPIVSVGGDDHKSNRGKTVGILLKIWVNNTNELRPFRDEGLSLLAETPVEEHLAMHWGMSLATYPFFGAVVAAVGRLVELQGGVNFAQVNRRMLEKYGQRISIRRGAQRAYYSLHDWGVLMPTEEKTIYTNGAPLPIINQRLASWLIEATMFSTSVQSVPLNSAVKSPLLFPFDVTLTRINKYQRLDTFRHGLNDEIIIRTNRSST